MFSSRTATTARTQEDDETDEEQPLLGPPIGDFKVIAKKGIPLREKPAHNAERTGEILEDGTIFTAVECVTPSHDDSPPVRWDHVPVDEACFLNIGGGRGWVVDRNIVSEEFMVESYFPIEKVGGFQAFRNNLRLFFQGKCYEYSIMSIVVLNAIFIGLEIDFGSMAPTWVWFVANGLFTLIYVVELTLKLLAWGVCQYFESHWNKFDFLVTIITCAGDVLLVWLHFSGSAVGSNHIEILSAIAPLLRLLRLLRLAKAFRDLRTLMKAFVSSLGSLFWIAIFALLWFYICACVTTVFLGSKDWLPDGSVPGAPDLRPLFRSIPMSMFTLFEVMTLEGWSSVVRPFLGRRPFLVAFFILFIFVTAFFLLNLVTAVVVDHTLAAQTNDTEAAKAVMADSQELHVKHLEEALVKKNHGKDYCHAQSVVEWSRTPGIRSILDRMDWDHEDVKAAVISSDTTGDGNISIAKLARVISESSRDLDTLSLLRVQAEMTQRLDRQEKMLQQLLNATAAAATEPEPPARTSTGGLASFLRR